MEFIRLFLRHETFNIITTMNLISVSDNTNIILPLPASIDIKKIFTYFFPWNYLTLSQNV